MNQQNNTDISGAIVKSAKIMHLCSAVIFLVAGLLLALVPDFDDSGFFRNALVGIASIVIGITGIYGYFSNDMYRLAFQQDFALGIFNVIFGILLIINPVQLSVLLPTAVSILTILDGGNKSQMALEGKSFGIRKWYWVLVSAILEIAAGLVLILLAYHELDVRAWMGIAMGLVGVVNFWTTMYTVRVRNTTHRILMERADSENKL
ncbi:MAG: DUF308 domain-containing protein [Clostridia bacterium]|nr:DUF308 domain-containing protein [Clostridia bacterium]